MGQYSQKHTDAGHRRRVTADAGIAVAVLVAAAAGCVAAEARWAVRCGLQFCSALVRPYHAVDAAAVHAAMPQVAQQQAVWKTLRCAFASLCNLA